MISEQELKDRCTPDIIKRMAELAEGFEYRINHFVDSGLGDMIDFKHHSIYIADLNYDTFYFPLLIHRAIEGYLKNNKSEMFKTNFELTFHFDNNATIKEYPFRNYQRESLTHAECAQLDCLLDIFEEVKQ